MNNSLENNEHNIASLKNMSFSPSIGSKPLLVLYPTLFTCLSNSPDPHPSETGGSGV
jgi:hypothetical protein